MRIALCQTKIAFENRQENLADAERLLDRERGKGVDLFLFPEMSFTGFSMNTAKTGEQFSDTPWKMRRLAEKYGAALGFGWVSAPEGGRGEENAGKAENHYTVVDASGRLLSDYVKIHPFSYAGEDRYFTGGNQLSYFNLAGHRIGTLICYDLRFPEVFQILADTCDVILVAANWPGKRREHWKTLLRARAIETQAYVCGVNCCGEQEGVFYAGDSAAFDPEGEPLCGFLEGEAVGYAEIGDKAALCREAFPVRQDRREDLYASYHALSSSSIR